MKKLIASFSFCMIMCLNIAHAGPYQKVKAKALRTIQTIIDSPQMMQCLTRNRLVRAFTNDCSDVVKDTHEKMNSLYHEVDSTYDPDVIENGNKLILSSDLLLYEIDINSKQIENEYEDDDLEVVRFIRIELIKLKAKIQTQ